MTHLLDLVGPPKCHGVRPRSLKVTTIPPLMAETAKGQANLHQLAIHWDRRGVAARDMANIYARNIARQKPPASNFARNACLTDNIPESIKNDPPVFSENTHRDGWRVSDSEFKGVKPHDRALKLSGARKFGYLEDVQREFPLVLPWGIVVDGKPIDPPGEITPPPHPSIQRKRK